MELIIMEDLENGGEEMSKGSGGPGVLNSGQEFFSLPQNTHDRDEHEVSTHFLNQ